MRGNYMMSAVTRALTKHFGGDLVVANEVIIQNAPGEYLFVHQINSEQSPSNGRFHNRFYFFNIRYHPDTKKHSQNKRISEITEQLYRCLTYIKTDDQPVKASSMRTEVHDGVLHFFVDYPIRVILPAPDVPDMQTLDINENLKE